MFQRKNKLSTQIKRRVRSGGEAASSPRPVISTGSTLLDLAISGTARKGGGIPSGILVEIFGPSGCGKTVLLCEIAGDIQRKGGEVMFFDPEARLNKAFARIFNLNTKKIVYSLPNTVGEMFEPIRSWDPPDPDVINGVCGDSLAALSTEMEMADKDKMGMRRAKEFSEELRKTCRILKMKNYLIVCSNQVRINTDAGPYEQKYITPGGLAISFYASIRLRCNVTSKIKEERTLKGGKTISRVVGVETTVYVEKNSEDVAYRSATVPIVFDYGIDDIRQNLQFLKNVTKSTTYAIGDTKLHRSLNQSCLMVEREGLEKRLRKHTIALWEEIEHSFRQERKPKQRF